MKQAIAELHLLTEMNGATVVLKWDLKKGYNIIWKDASMSDIILNFKDISDQHVKLWLSPTDDEFGIEDLNSEEGTFRVKQDGVTQKFH